MDPSRLLRTVGTLTRRTWTDVRDADGELTATETTARIWCWVQPEGTKAGTAERTAGQNTQAQRWIGYFRTCDDLEGWDSLTVAGTTYEFAGPAQTWTNPRTRVAVYQAAPLEVTS